MAPSLYKPLLALGATLAATSAFVPPVSSPAAAARSSSAAARAATTAPAPITPASPLLVHSEAPRLPSTRLQAAPSLFDFFKPQGQTAQGSKGPGNKKIVVLTGTSSGLGRATLKALAARGDHYVICGVRDPEKMERVAQELNLSPDVFTIRYLDLAIFDSVRKFARDVKAIKGGKPLDALVCNAAVYLPAKPVPTFTPDGIEESLQINHLSHFLLVSLLLDDLKKAKDPRCVIVGSITGNDNTIAGAFVWPRASLGELKGMERGAKQPVSMIDGNNFNGAKAYKDSKMCNMMTMLELHRRYHDSTGITFASMYPGCIAESALFREKRQWFRTIFPIFMKYVTGGYVSEEEAGERLAQTVYDPQTRKSGTYWCWNGQGKNFGFFDPATGQVRGAGGSGGQVFAGELAGQVLDQGKASKMWDLSCEITGANFPKVGAGAGAGKQLASA